MAIKYHSNETNYTPKAKARTAKWIRRAIESEGYLCDEVNYIFCSPESHLAMNRQFLGHDWPTDVITFDYSEGRKVSGDIFIDPATVMANAEALLIAPEVEMRRVMIHGVLHLCGHGDKTLRQQRAMRRLEDTYLREYYETV
ncbi:MAG: rRNA maturation RNase YbeY [Alistipes sp.]|jgi:rRNA maturation RNase YbeY|nr:rRNA maturation RNase YbeY [Alistipes sp.]